MKIKNGVSPFSREDKEESLVCFLKINYCECNHFIQISALNTLCERVICSDDVNTLFKNEHDNLTANNYPRCSAANGWPRHNALRAKRGKPF